MRQYTALSALILCAACAVGPDYERPDIVVAKWFDPPQTAEVKQPVHADWWDAFDDPMLSELVDDAVRHNHDYAIAKARVQEARALRRVARSPLLPSFGAQGSYSTTRASLNEAGASPFFIEQGLAARQQDVYDAQFDAAWEIDIFGGNRRALEAADARAEAAVAARRDVLLSVMAEVARNYLELRGRQKRLALLQKNAELQARTVALVEEKWQIGLAREVDYTRANAQLETTRAQIPGLEAGIQAISYRLAVLTGRQPGALYATLRDAEPLPVPGELVPLGLKSDLLRRRPDIQYAERQLAAATAEIGEATAALYPSFNLTGHFGYRAATSAGDLLQSASETWLFTPFINLPLFEGGRLRARIDATQARESQAALAYEQTVLRALEETEAALVRYAREQETRARQARATRQAARSAELANHLYEQGLTDFIDVLDAERALTQAEEALAQSETRALTNLVALYKSLGGGWEVVEGQSGSKPAPEPLATRTAD